MNSHKKDFLIICGVILIFIAIFSTGKYGLWLIYILLGLVALYTIASIILQSVSIRRNGLNYISFLKLIAKCALLFLANGTFLYILTFLRISKSDFWAEFSNAELFFRSLICSFDLFLLDIDSNIIDRIDDAPALKAWIFIQAIISAVCTAVVFLSLIITRLKALWELNVKTKITPEKSHLYLFFGLNKPSEILASQIGKEDPASIIIMIDEANVKDEDADGFDNILAFIAHRRKSFSYVNRINAVIAIANERIDRIEVSPQEKGEIDIFDKIGLTKVKKLLLQLNDKKIRDAELKVFFFGEDEDRNIHDLLMLARDTTLNTLTSGDVPVTVYCHARKSGVAEYLEDMGLRKKLRVEIVDSSKLAVDSLKLDEENHPVNFVNLSTDNPATVSSKFKALIIGFGEVGRDALRFLYEFGAFPDEGSSENNSFRSPFECLVVDENMERLKGGFIHSAPELFNAKSGISFYNYSSHDSGFYEEVLSPENSCELNYVVVATGDDNENLNLALRIFRHLRGNGNPMENLRILVRCNSEDNLDMMSRYIAFHNEAHAPGGDVGILKIFGNPKSIFTYDLIIGDKIEEEAKAYYDRYRTQANEKETWEERRMKLTKEPVSLDNLRKLRRKEGQDIENALHASTKINILKKSLGERYDYQDFCRRYFTKDKKVSSGTGIGESKRSLYPELTDDEFKIVLNLAMLEHIRWIASHELMGYRTCSPDEGTDEKTGKHSCLVPWQDLDEVSRLSSTPDFTIDYKKYDFFVVDTTINLKLSGL